MVKPDDRKTPLQKLRLVDNCGIALAKKDTECAMSQLIHLARQSRDGVMYSSKAWPTVVRWCCPTALKGWRSGMEFLPRERCCWLRLSRAFYYDAILLVLLYHIIGEVNKLTTLSCVFVFLQSINVTDFGGFTEPGTVDISPLRRGANAPTGAGGEMYSCGGSFQVGWNFTGLVENVDVRVSYCGIEKPERIFCVGALHMV